VGALIASVGGAEGGRAGRAAGGLSVAGIEHSMQSGAGDADGIGGEVASDAQPVDRRPADPARSAAPERRLVDRASELRVTFTPREFAGELV
jgi:hypothetical protein